MFDDANISAVLVALFLPWLVGSLLMRRVLARSRNSNMPLVVGHGYFVGVFLVTLIMRLFDAIQVPITFHSVAIATLTCSVLAFWRSPVSDSKSFPPIRETLDGWSRIAIGLLLALVALRYYTLAAEVALRPIYSWDAWMNWAPKAIVWLHHGEMVPFVTPERWLSNVVQPSYTLGNAAASTYPHTVPLLFWWMMMAADNSSSGMIMLPWVLAPLALCSAMYGHLRSSGVAPLLGIIAVYALANMPYINVHSALAGYADIWLTAAFSLALFSAAARKKTGELRWTLICLFWCLLCLTLKKPGVVYASISMVALASSIFHTSRKLILVVLGVAPMCLLLIFFVGVSIEIPGIGHFRLDQKGLELPYLGSHNFVTADVTHPAAKALFGMINWNLLFYLAIAALLAGAIVPQTVKNARSPVLTGVLLGVGFFVFIFYFTHYASALKTFVTFNRVVMYLAPGIGYLLVRYIHCVLKAIETKNG